MAAISRTTRRRARFAAALEGTRQYVAQLALILKRQGRDRRRCQPYAGGEPAVQLRAGRRHRQHAHAPVARYGVPLDQTALLEPVDKPRDIGSVARQDLGEIPHGARALPREHMQRVRLLFGQVERRRCAFEMVALRLEELDHQSPGLRPGRVRAASVGRTFGARRRSRPKR